MESEELKNDMHLDQAYKNKISRRRNSSMNEQKSFFTKSTLNFALQMIM